MGKYKICPNCGEKNDPSRLECEKCSEELINVRISDDSEAAPEISGDIAVLRPEMVKICDCGAKNPPNARKCISCGEDISDILPEENRTISRSLRLLDTDGNEILKMTDGNVIIGRSSGLREYLREKKYVSNTHCRLSFEDEAYYAEDLKSTNSTFVNNRKITEKTKLSDNDELALGGIIVNGERQEKAAYFIIRIE